MGADMTTTPVRVIRTPDQRLRVFISSTLQELAEERLAARQAVEHLRLAPVLFELGARPHPPKELYRAYLEQSHIFVGIYWQKYGWVAPDMTISGLEDEYNLSGDKVKLIYIKSPAPDREPRLKAMLDRLKTDDVSYKYFTTADELRESLENDLAMILSERFEAMAESGPATMPIRPIKPVSVPPAAPRNNLPAVRTSLVGRESERALVVEMLTQSPAASRLITLTGPGGIGKTRLTLQIGLDVAGHFPDGVCQVALASINDPDLVAAAIARALDVREAAGQSLIDHLYDFLRDKRLLLILDNFEQVVEAAPLVSGLLEHCRHLRVLVTSRTALRLRGEREVPLPPLALPTAGRWRGDEPELAQTLSQYAAISLFVARAQDVKPDFKLTTANALTVARICQQLDGLPLAIELAAARIKIMSPQMLLTRLEDRLEVLKSGARDLPARQQTMREAIGWSYDLLDEDEKVLFARLAVFAGGCTLDAVETICGRVAQRSVQVFEHLSMLVDKSLVVHEDTPGGEPRFRLLQTIREFAREKLVNAGEINTVQRQHAEYYLQQVEIAEPHFTAPDRAGYIDRMELELDNIRGALKWSRTADGDHSLGARLAGALAWFWFLRGHLTEGRSWLEGAVTCLSPDQALEPWRAKALYGASGLAWAQGDYVPARRYALESLAIYRERGEPLWTARALMSLSLVALGQADADLARRASGEAVQLFRRAGDTWHEAFATRGLGDAALLQGDIAGAQQKYEESLVLWRSVGDAWGLAMPLNDLGRTAMARSDFAAAQQYYRESIGLLRQADNQWLLALVQVGYAYALLHLDDLAAARQAFVDGLALWRQLGNRTGIIQCIAGCAGLAARQQQPLRAAQLFGAADALFTSIGFPLEGSTGLEFERNLNLARAQAEASAFEAAWQIGQTLTMEQAIALALADG